MSKLRSLCSLFLRTLSTSQNPQFPETLAQNPLNSQTLAPRFQIPLLDADHWGFSTAPHLKSPKNSDSFDPRNDPDDQSADFNDIEDLRARKMLFYKLDKGSKEFEEYNIEFHRRGKKTRVTSKKNAGNFENRDKVGNVQKDEKSKFGIVENYGKSGFVENCKEWEMGDGKRVRVPTFNQMTEMYHMPFCLDIYVSKGSVRACVVHRVSSKVIAVAHSISKDMKFDMKSRKDASACTAVGGVMAKRALEDDIHNVVYTPRKGERIEGKIQIVLQAIIDNGVDVKVKLKQKQKLHEKRLQAAQFAAA